MKRNFYLLIIALFAIMLMAGDAVHAATTIGTAITTASTITATGALYGNGGLDLSAAGALAIGATNATSVVITPATTLGGALTVTSGARIGTGSTPNDFSALASDSLFVEGKGEFDGTLRVDGAVTFTSSLNVTSGVILQSTLAVTGATTVSTFTEGGGVTVTTTIAASVLPYTYFDTENELSIAPKTVAITAATLTFPASSTLTAFIPTAGQTRQIMVMNATTTAYALTLAAGAGETVYSASTTAVIKAGQRALLTFFRKANTDISILMSIFH
ncbi:MAG: hypothetical protein NTZ18_01270 [Candidatus Komeilibacteria bacterium]|nr:hypothetical protein [Candidatus Komeilibacteria bacterium]